MFYMNCGSFQVVGASPELLCKGLKYIHSFLLIVENDKVFAHPIAGTKRRGNTEEEDLKLESELLSDPKERAEHMFF